MFIEKLKDEDFNAFAEMFDCSVSSIKFFDEKKDLCFLELFNGAMGPQPFLTLTDFECKLNEYYIHFENQTNTLWQKFLFKKFGEEYKDALAKHLLTQVDELTK